ncbi:MAG: terpene cyclase/mutase family protein [Planctomycetaceae bacterium]|jgi:squalene-hopene/tetraprenyl-beta-curcumene cyclase|nr:terpene cyclase/mutase family protein [Planctomycetaceae bacterium]
MDYVYNMEKEQTLAAEVTPLRTAQQVPPLTTELRKAVALTRQFFFNHQHPDGYWVGELEGDALLQSEAVMLLAFLGEEDSKLAFGCANRLLETQLEDGGWGQYTGAPSDVCNTVKAYFALKITGHSPSADYMQRARRRALELGGVDKVNSFTRFYLALLGQIPYSVCPAVPPQMMFLPRWFPINIYAMSSWSRTIFVPLSIVSALQPVKHLPPEKGIQEIFVKPVSQWKALVAPGKKLTRNPFSWDFFFRGVDNGMKLCRRTGLTPFRKRAVQKALQWTLAHCERSDGPGAIQPPIVWTRIALKALGYADDSPEVRYCRKQIDDLVIWNDESCRIQPCKSPVWDTVLTLKSLLVGGLTKEHPAVSNALRWVRQQRIKTAGGWCFEFHNDFYPDCDDTAMALMVLGGQFDESRIQQSAAANKGSLPPDLRLTSFDNAGSLDDAKQKILDIEETKSAIENGLHWLLSMQNKDGGWAAFDKNNNKEILCKVPFADHNAMIDPSTPDLTGRVLESLGRLGYRTKINPEIDRCVAFMRKQQQGDGSWFGRWGVNYIYGTWQALTGLTAVGVVQDAPMITAGVNWLLTHQQENGGWGETPRTYDEPALRGTGTTTASQTAWAVMGLLTAAANGTSCAVERGIKYLLYTQRDDGTWYEPEYTGTGFPQVFYLKYHYYSVYFPLMALSMYASRTSGPAAVPRNDDETEAVLRMSNVRIFNPENEFYNNRSSFSRPVLSSENPPALKIFQE